MQTKMKAVESEEALMSHVIAKVGNKEDVRVSKPTKAMLYRDDVHTTTYWDDKTGITYGMKTDFKNHPNDTTYHTLEG